MAKKALVLSSYEFLKQFNTEFKCLKFLEKNLWKNGVKCGWCNSKRVSRKNKKAGFFQCKDCRKKFNVRTNTIFHRSKIHLRKWLYAVYLLQTARKGISSLQLSKQIGVTQKTAWFMLHRLRSACKSGQFKMSGEVQSDETYFGGKNKNRHKDKKKVKTWQSQKTMVQGIRADNQLKFHIINSPDKKTLQGNIVKNVEAGSHIMTDENMAYRGLDKLFKHSSVKHSAGVYVCPLSGASTNDMESVWALMKRGYKGVYHHWSKKHLHRYIEEFAFRLDKGSCAIDTIDRVKSLVQNSENKRLTYKVLTA